MIEPSVLATKLKAAFTDAIIEVRDLTGTMDHYEVTIVSQAFEGLMRIKRHRLVYDVLEEELKGPIHALTLQLYTPAQWEQAQ